jgi:hypothetical protein
MAAPVGTTLLSVGVALVVVIALWLSFWVTFRRLRNAMNAIKPPIRSSATTPPTMPPIRAALSSDGWASEDGVVTPAVVAFVDVDVNVDVSDEVVEVDDASDDWLVVEDNDDIVAWLVVVDNTNGVADVVTWLAVVDADEGVGAAVVVTGTHIRASHVQMAFGFIEQFCWECQFSKDAIENAALRYTPDSLLRSHCWLAVDWNWDVRLNSS